MSRSWFAALVLVAASSPGVQAGDVPLYTNADLERYRTPETADDPARPVLSPAATSATELQGPCLTADGWAFVAAFLEREYARLDADRRSELERSRLEAVASRPIYVGVPYYPHFRHPGRPPGAVRPHRPRTAPKPRLDGRDAVPGPRSNRPSRGYELQLPEGSVHRPLRAQRPR